MLEKTGIPTKEDLAGVLPPLERLRQGAVAIIECFQPIPCDPCYHSCPLGAIEEFKELNDLPRLDYTKCSGCGLCAVNCPGQAIFIVDYSREGKEGIVKLPYEYLPLPQAGEKVIALDRAGHPLGKGVVEKVQAPLAYDKTALVWLRVPLELVMEVRNFKLGDGKDE